MERKRGTIKSDFGHRVSAVDDCILNQRGHSNLIRKFHERINLFSPTGFNPD